MAAGAVGMAFGPAMSAVFNGVDFTVAGVQFNGLTNPGWIMFVLWVILGWIIQIEFQVKIYVWRHVCGGKRSTGTDLDRCSMSPPGAVVGSP